MAVMHFPYPGMFAQPGFVDPFAEVTEFIDNAIGIDPVGCGCTDCAIGISIPWDYPQLDDLAVAFIHGRAIVNRTEGPIDVIIREDGTATFKAHGERSIVLVFPIG